MLKFSYFIVIGLMLITLSARSQSGPCLDNNHKELQKQLKLIYNEEFRSNKTIDLNWKAQNASPGHILSSRWRENLCVRCGKLFIMNRKEDRGGKAWTSGRLSRGSFSYGYFECRMRISKATGVNNSFWVSASRMPGKNAFEVDFCEVHYPNIIHFTVHDHGGEKSDRNPTATFVYKPDLDLSAGYHVYGCFWDTNTISFFFDGEMIWETPNLVCDHAGEIVLGSAVLKWAGEVTDRIDGTSMQVDYVRVWQRDE